MSSHSPSILVMNSNSKRSTSKREGNSMKWCSTPMNTSPQSRNKTAPGSEISCLDGDKTTSSSSIKLQDRLRRDEFKLLQCENEELKAELTYIKSLYKQLTEETKREKFDERRINLLKSQVIQLERQVSLQSWALNARTNVLTEIEGQLLCVIDHLRSLHTNSDVTSYSRISDLLSSVEGIRHSLYKSVEVLRFTHDIPQATNLEQITLPAIYMGKFFKVKKNTKSQQELTLLDVCSGKLEHLNIKQVSKLESKLCKLYKHLLCVKEFLHHSNDKSVLLEQSVHIGQPIKCHLQQQLESTLQYLHECCQDLLSLSVLLPSAPWPPLSKHIKEGFTLEDVMSHMPPGLSKKKDNEIHSVVEALMKANSYSHHMSAIEIKILKEELSYHQNVYQLQLDYTTSLLSSVRTAYSEFEKRTCEMICGPLDKILNYYEALKSTASEEDLRLFLTSFKENADKISDAVECLQTYQDNSGMCALSDYGQHFLESLNTLTRECAVKRDDLMKALLVNQNESHNQV